jgi:hypothetical protein
MVNQLCLVLCPFRRILILFTKWRRYLLPRTGIIDYARGFTQLMVVRCSSYVVAAVDDSSPMFSFIAVVNMFKFIVQR